MSSSVSPPNHSAYGGDDGADRSPLSALNARFIRSLTDKRTNRDGQPAKRRGPKPDSRPALTRRQELNRQAQRTHRERKEHYIKALEDEVLRLKEIYSTLAQDKDRLAEENRQLKTLLSQSGMQLGTAGGGGGGSGSGSGAPGHPESRNGGGGGLGHAGQTPGNGHSYSNNGLNGLNGSGAGGPVLDDIIIAGYMSSGSGAPSYGPPSCSRASAITPPRSAGRGAYAHKHGRGTTTEHLHGFASNSGCVVGSENRTKAFRVDYDQAGIDFVLTLEKPCMHHLPVLLERTEAGGSEPCGHALMASCPPEPFSALTPDIPFGFSHASSRLHVFADDERPPVPPEKNGPGPPTPTQQQTWDLSKADLSTLLDLSSRLDLDGEITPVMAWGMVLGHPRLGELRLNDFTRLADELIGKVRCYGFGAVMEEFEVRDALEGVFSNRPDPALQMVY